MIDLFEKGLSDNEIRNINRIGVRNSYEACSEEDREKTFFTFEIQKPIISILEIGYITSVFSNLNNDFFFFDEAIKFNSVEKFMIYKKAELFLNRELQKKILETEDFNDLYNLGRNINFFHEDVWNFYRREINYWAHKQRVIQNDFLKLELLKTDRYYLSYSSKSGLYWGEEITKKKDNSFQNNGKNITGKNLMQIRHELSPYSPSLPATGSSL